jgi:hypothetical protein
VNEGTGRHFAARSTATGLVGKALRQCHGQPEKMAKIEMPRRPAKP